ncbi:RuBisCO large subunit C-terminal-like domain-containing protein [Haloimpatiens sp. FM7315]|uniref:RuBisCO large subunit C-terminal-like domain-containing protein n=1 Tax=Haloimpatiens sp. FM7315 TaxID=3298609 RepID=UPI0035A344FD
MSKIDVTSLPISLPEGIDYDEYLRATYLAVFPSDVPIHSLAPVLAVEQSTGTWTPVPGETPEVRKKHVAKVTGVYEVPDYEFEMPKDVKTRSYIIEIAYPIVNIGSQIPMLLTTVVGNICMGGQIKLLDIRFPEKFVKGFKGPKFGIKGVRKLLGVKDRPLLNNMTKPCTGYTPEVGVELFKAAALGGVDIVKDDELIANASFNSVEDRVKLYMEAEKEIYEKKGEKTLYTVNVTDSIPNIFENAKRAIDAGANAIMVNYIATGFPVLRALAEDPNINVPILAHMDVAGAYYMSPVHGIASSLILGKLARLAGADIVVVPAPYGKAPILKHQFKNIAANLSFPMYDLKPTFPMPSGGITPLNVPQVMKDLGTEIIIGSGGGIHAHPQGPTAGGRAFRQAIDAAMVGMPMEEAVKQYPELAAAVKVWGDPMKKFKVE